MPRGRLLLAKSGIVGTPRTLAMDGNNSSSEHHASKLRSASGRASILEQAFTERNEISENPAKFASELSGRSGRAE